jgi:hypothetical protein
LWVRMSETLIAALAGILATLVSSLAGLYFVNQARAAPFREQLYSRQFELLQELAQLVGRMENFATLLTSDDEDHRNRAYLDLHAEFPKLFALNNRGFASATRRTVGRVPGVSIKGPRDYRNIRRRSAK